MCLKGKIFAGWRFRGGFGGKRKEEVRAAVLQKSVANGDERRKRLRRKIFEVLAAGTVITLPMLTSTGITLAPLASTGITLTLCLGPVLGLTLT